MFTAEMGKLRKEHDCILKISKGGICAFSKGEIW